MTPIEWIALSVVILVVARQIRTALVVVTRSKLAEALADAYYNGLADGYKRANKLEGVVIPFPKRPV